MKICLRIPFVIKWSVKRPSNSIIQVELIFQIVTVKFNNIYSFQGERLRECARRELRWASPSAKCRLVSFCALISAAMHGPGWSVNGRLAGYFTGLPSDKSVYKCTTCFHTAVGYKSGWGLLNRLLVFILPSTLKSQLKHQKKSSHTQKSSAVGETVKILSRTKRNRIFDRNKTAKLCSFKVKWSGPRKGSAGGGTPRDPRRRERGFCFGTFEISWRRKKWVSPNQPGRRWRRESA